MNPDDMYDTKEEALSPKNELYGGYFSKNLQEYHEFINAKLVEGVEKTVRAGKGAGKDISDLNDKSKEALKEKA